MTSSAAANDDETRFIHVGRQPIYDRSGDVIAYELLFRDTSDAENASRRSAQATSRVIIAAFTEFGLAELAGSKACFVNVTREFLVGDLPVPFDANQAVLEIIETVHVDDTVVAGVQSLVDRGFTLALDDFVRGTESERLLDMVTYVKIDMLDTEAAETAETVRHCRKFPHLQLIAERLETEDQLQQAMELGFEYFQGHVLGRPHILSKASLSPSRVGRLQLIAALNATEQDLDEIVDLISRDPAITYRLLQATNAAASGLSARVSSVRDAAVLLGMATVRQWVTLMLFSDLTEATEEQLMATMIRARLCQLLAEEVGADGGAAFTVGLLSGIAELLAEPADDLISQLPLSAPVAAALTDGIGDLGQVLSVVRAYEQGEPAAALRMVGIDIMVPTYLSAVGWSRHTLQGALGTASEGPADANTP
ncbi:EAL and HDOD domain-containing protein [Couchioplanes azureus]|nr:HDOD domain-containing protein [Couchioplanes caeruleus]GGQ82810.1 histidine kinase [Couchioplanes caeruleus subsp. azureus]